MPCSISKSMSLPPSIKVIGAAPWANPASTAPFAKRDVATMVPRTALNRYSEPRRAVQVLALDGSLVTLSLHDLAYRGNRLHLSARPPRPNCHRRPLLFPPRQNMVRICPGFVDRHGMRPADTHGVRGAPQRPTSGP